MTAGKLARFNDQLLPKGRACIAQLFGIQAKSFWLLIPMGSRIC